MHILLIEPDRLLGPTYQSALTAAGHSVVLCRSGQKALDSVDDKLPDVVILELQLGIHNGIEFLYELRSQSDWQNIPVIVHTINDHAEDDGFNKSFKQLGVTQIFYKPRTSISQLVKAVDRIALTTV